MSAPIIKQLEERMRALDAEFGRKKRPLVPFAPFPRSTMLRQVVFAKLGLRNEIEARISCKAAFKNSDGNLSHLLVCRTSAVVEQCLFGGVPGIKAALLDLAAFATIWADCIEALSKPHSKPGGQ